MTKNKNAKKLAEEIEELVNRKNNIFVIDSYSKRK